MPGLHSVLIATGCSFLTAHQQRGSPDGPLNLPWIFVDSLLPNTISKQPTL